MKVNQLSYEEANAMSWVAYFDPADDYIRNPGMGFVGYAHSDHMNKGKFCREEYNTPTYEELERMISNPYCDNVYLRVEWRDIQSEKGKLNFFKTWENTLELVEKYNKTWSFRIMSAHNGSKYKNSIPEFLNDKITLRPYPNDEIKDHTAYFTRYDENFFAPWSEMLELLGEKYDNDPRLAWADISGYGKWGEMHHWPFDFMDDPSTDVYAIHRLIDDHMKAFPKTPAVSMALPSWDYETSSWKDAPKIYAFEKGCWIRRDSFYPGYSMWEHDIVRQVQDNGGALIFEPGHYPGLDKPGRNNIPGMPYGAVYDRLLDLGSAYIALGFNPWQAFRTLDNYEDMLKSASKRIGYRVRPAVVRMSDGTDNRPRRVCLCLKNDGVCPPPGALIVTLKFASGEVVRRELPQGFPAPGRLEHFDIALPDGFDNFDNNSFVLSAELRTYGKIAPVAWAVKPTAENPDRYNLRCSVPTR